MYKTASIAFIISLISLAVFAFPVQAGSWETFQSATPGDTLAGYNSWSLWQGNGSEIIATTTDFIDSYVVGYITATNTTAIMNKPISGLDNPDQGQMTFYVWGKRPGQLQYGDCGVTLYNLTDGALNNLLIYAYDYATYGDNTLYWEIDGGTQSGTYEYNEDYPVKVDYRWYNSATTSFYLQLTQTTNLFQTYGTRDSTYPTSVNLQSSSAENCEFFVDYFYIITDQDDLLIDEEVEDDVFYIYDDIIWTEVPGFRQIYPALQQNFPFNIFLGLFDAVASTTATTTPVGSIVLNSPTTSPISYSLTLFDESKFDYFALGVTTLFKNVIAIFLWLMFLRYFYMRIRNFFQTDTIAHLPRGGDSKGVKYVYDPHT